MNLARDTDGRENMTPFSDLTELTAVDLARLIASREVSSTEVVQAFLDRIDLVNPHLNAFPVIMAEEALRQAAATDAASARGEVAGPLHGVPFTVKLNIDVAGTATTWGVPVLGSNIAAADAPAVERLRSAGGIPLARSNMPDLALRHDTDSSMHGRTINPTRPDRTPGGSSGGEGAALAARLTPLGLGNDLGGSLRSPAHCCGVMSLRPTPGVVPDAAVTLPDVPNLAAQILNVQGPMARRVADLELAMNVIAGPHPRDPWSVPLATARRVPSSGRVAVVADTVLGPVADEVAEALSIAAARLAEAGFVVTEVVPPHWDDAIEGWHRLTACAFAAQTELINAVAGDNALRFMAGSRTEPPDAAGLLELLENRTRWSREWSADLAGFDVVLAPVWTQSAFAVDLDVRDPQAVTTIIAPGLPAAFLGRPVATVPITVGPGTCGVQLIGDRFREDLCLSTAHRLEEV
ncbi:amidase family protein [Amycolatopsis sp. cmx-4-68]|uniref:amidase family protein n=1 Tax=Amycolatopsis sp. cmx-4-68 TaxID=2790938 RepID=UPI00397C2C86